MKYVLFVVLITIFSFTSPSEPAKLESFNVKVSEGKVMLDWTVSGNSTADKFEIESSKDAKNFKVVAVVFASENPGKGNYLFYEKVNSKRLIYRVKLINKDKKTEYSKPIYVKQN